MTTKQMIDIIRSSRVTLTHRVLIAIAGRLEEQEALLQALTRRVAELEKEKICHG